MKIRFFALATLALALVACNNDNENLNGGSSKVQKTDVRIVAATNGNLTVASLTTQVSWFLPSLLSICRV